MTVERRTEALSQLGKDIDPFARTPMAEKARVIGLRNLYAQMVDPSLEVVETVARSLADFSPNQLGQLISETFDVGDDPGKYYARKSVQVNDPRSLLPGISNTHRLIEEISWERKYIDEGIVPETVIDVSGIAENSHNFIQVKKGEQQLRQVAEEASKEPDIKRRYELGLILRDHVLAYATAFPFVFLGGAYEDKPFDPTWDNLATNKRQYDIRLKRKNAESLGEYGIKTAVKIARASISRYVLEQGLEKMPPKDKERFDELRLKYGAKAANLILLSELTEGINNLRGSSFNRLTMVVPDFQPVPVEVYRAWKEGKSIDDLIRPYFEWANELKDQRLSDGQMVSADYMVRSSAVFSEDGETLTGAGIYDSVEVAKDTTFDDFKTAVTQVFESTDSPKAQAYREQHGVDEEEMGLVIQKYVSPSTAAHLSQSQIGYANSRLNGVPQLLEVVTRTSRNFIDRSELDFYSGEDIARSNDEVFQTVHHFPPDARRAIPTMLVRVAQLTQTIERLWGGEIQIEFVADRSTINIVQVRDLPKYEESEMPKVEFPEAQPVYWGPSIGIGDVELPMLDGRDNNSAKIGVVTFSTNYGFSGWDNPQHLPKEGAVIITSTGGENGHIQTLCAERGLICLFSDGSEDDRYGPKSGALEKLKRIRVVSNGLEARVYPAQESFEIKTPEPFSNTTDKPNEIAELCAKLAEGIDEARIRSGYQSDSLNDSFFDVSYFVERAGQFCWEYGGTFSDFVSMLGPAELQDIYNNLVTVLNIQGTEDNSAGRESSHINDTAIEDPLFSIYELVREKLKGSMK